MVHLTYSDGVSTVSLGGAIKGAPAITEPGPEGVPVSVLIVAPELNPRVARIDVGTRPA